MIARSAGPRRRLARSLLLLSAVVGAGQAAAQPGTPPVPQQRTGPEAKPPALPAFPVPSTVPPLMPQEPAFSAPAAAQAGASSAGPRVTEVSVMADGEGDPVPPRDWAPPQDPGSGFSLQHRPGELLDAGWIRRQFVEHGMIPAGTSAGRALALIQLINRAYLSAGFVNSGVVVADGAALSGGTLNLRLVYGRLVAPDPAVPPVSVAWGEGGSRGLTAGYLRNRMSSAEARPLNAIDIERDFRRLAEDPAIRTINADLRPGSRPGEASLALTVLPADPFDLYLSFANSRSPSVGGERAAIGTYLRNVLSAGDILNGEFGATDGLEDGTIAYVTPFLGPRTFLSEG